MRAVVAREFGNPDVLSVEEVAVPAPEAGEVRVAVRAASIGFADVLITAGRYQAKPALPYIPGTEFAGVIDAVGAGVSPALIGARVCAAALGGGFAEFAIAPVRHASIIPATMSLEDAAVFRGGHATAYYALVQRGCLSPDETVLVLGAGGGVGLAAVQVAKVLKARVIASASSATKRDMAARVGADVVVDSNDDNWRALIRDLTGGRGVDLVVDPVGGAASEPAFRALAWKGRHLVIGFAQGEIPRLATNLALVKGAALIGVDGRQFELREPETAAANLARLFALYEEGAVRPLIGLRCALSEVRAAMFAATTRVQSGRVVLVVPQP